MREKIRRWWNGKFIPYENDPNSSVVLFGGSTEYHWTARIAHVMWDFYLREWKWIWTSLFTITAVIVAVAKLL